MRRRSSAAASRLRARCRSRPRGLPETRCPWPPGAPPQPGSTKTRLVPPLTPASAAALYRGFLLDSVHLALGLGWDQVSLVHPAGCGAPLARLLPPQVALLEQPRQGLRDALWTGF